MQAGRGIALALVALFLEGCSITTNGTPLGLGAPGAPGQAAPTPLAGPLTASLPTAPGNSLLGMPGGLVPGGPAVAGASGSAELDRWPGGRLAPADFFRM